MSVHYSSIVWDIVMPNSGRKIVALALADMANDDGHCWPSVKLLANRCNMRPEAVRNHLSALEAIGLISKSSQFKDNRQISNMHQFMSLAELRGRVAKIARGEGSDFHQGGGGRKSPRGEPSKVNRHIEPSVKGAIPHSRSRFSDRNRRPYPRTEDEMVSILLQEKVIHHPDYDGQFFDNMVKNRWRVQGKPVADWVKLIEARQEITVPKPQERFKLTRFTP